MLHNHLLDGGEFIFEVETLAAIHEPQGVWLCRWLDKDDDSKLLLSTVSRFDPATSIETVLCRYELWQDGRIINVEVEEICLRLYRVEEIESLLTKTGFVVKNRLIPYSREKATGAEPLLLYECEKNLG